MRPLAILALAAALAAVALAPAARAQEPVVDGAAADAAVEPAADGARDPESTPPIATTPLRDGGRVGLALLGIGAAVTASTAAASTLIEALSVNDQDPRAPPKNPELVQLGGFATVTAMSLGVGAMLLGGALLVNDLADAP